MLIPSLYSYIYIHICGEKTKITKGLFIRIKITGRIYQVLTIYFKKCYNIKEDLIIPSGVGKGYLEKRKTTHSSILTWKMPMDGGAWRNSVHGVAKSWTQMSNKEQSLLK